MSRIVDFHIHCNSSDPEQVKQLAETCEKYEVAAALVGGLRYGATDYVPNEQVIQICREYPDLFYPLAKIDLWEAPPNPDEASRLAEAGVRGFKFIYPYYAYDDDRYMPIYERIETLGLPVLFHTGDFRPSSVDAVWRRPVLRNMDPVALDRIARSFPKLNIVMAHLGTSLWRVPAAELDPSESLHGSCRARKFRGTFGGGSGRASRAAAARLRRGTGLLPQAGVRFGRLRRQAIDAGQRTGSLPASARPARPPGGTECGDHGRNRRPLAGDSAVEMTGGADFNRYNPKTFLR